MADTPRTVSPLSTASTTLTTPDSRPCSPPPPAEHFTPAPATAPYTIVPLPHKGLSVLSTRRIPADTRLLTAEPLLLLHTKTGCTPALILAAFDRLPAETQATYLTLCHGLTGDGWTREDMVLGVWKCNNFCLDAEGTVNAVFDIPSRLNHACVGGENCVWRWEQTEDARGGVWGRIEFEVERDVEEGEELTHCYRPDWRLGTARRREMLMEEYGFWCQCRVCLDPESDDE